MAVTVLKSMLLFEVDMDAKSTYCQFSIVST